MIVEHIGNNQLHSISPVKNVPYWNKPEGGLWTSPTESDYTWRRWCIDERYSLESLKWNFMLDVNVSNILMIDSVEDLYHKVVEKGFMLQLNRDLLVFTLDFEALSAKYDGIWLTTKGEHETRFSEPYSLYGWDCESVLLFNENPIVEVIEKKYRQ